MEPVEGSLELTSADKFSIPNVEKLSLQIGDTVKIVYNGDILESYPAQLGDLYKITLLEQAKADARWDRIPMVRAISAFFEREKNKEKHYGIKGERI